MSDSGEHHSRIRSSLQGRVPITPWGDEELRKKAAKLWHETGTVMIQPGWLLNEFDRQHMINIGEKLFGRRA